MGIQSSSSMAAMAEWMAGFSFTVMEKATPALRQAPATEPA